MECVPRCVNCSGACKTLTVPPRDTSTPTAVTGRIAVPTGSGYIALKCGHYTTPEEQILHDSLNSLSRRYSRKAVKPYCDTCGKRVARRPAPRLTASITGYSQPTLDGEVPY
jgi:hypothetical protein